MSMHEDLADVETADTTETEPAGVDLDAAGAETDAQARLVGFRAGLRGCFTKRGDTLFELTDGMLCTQGPVRSPAELSMEPEFRRGHGSAYAALAKGRTDAARLRRLHVEHVEPARPGEPPMFGVDTTPLARPDADHADSRTMVQLRRKGGDVFLPGWNYSVVVGVDWGASSWVTPVEARRVTPDDDHTDLTVGQVRDVLADLAAAGKTGPGDPPPLFMFDAGNDATAIACDLAGEHVQTLTRLGSRRVFRADPDPRPPGRRGAPARHGRRLPLDKKKAAERPAPDDELTASSARYGRIRVQAWRNMHQELGRDGHWADWPREKELPIVRGTVIRINVERLPGERKPHKDIWLFHSAPPGVEPDVDLLWKAYLRRFDQEHFHKFLKSHLGLGAAHLGTAEAADRWVQLALAAYAQLRLAHTLTGDLRRPWHRKTEPGEVLTPYRTRLGFRRLRARLGSPAHGPKFTRPGPGRPKGSKNRPKARRPPHRKTPTPDTVH